jgi:hypothetical protein
MKIWIQGVSLLAVILLPCLCASAAPRNGGDAANAVQGWLKLDPRPFGNFLSSKIKRTETIKGASGKAIYHVVHLSPHGYVVVSADDAIEPIIAFSSVGDFDSSATQGITPWVNYDLAKRRAHVPAGAGSHVGHNAHQRWQPLLAASPNPPPDMETNSYATVVSAVMVAPFLQTSWNQQGDQGNNLAVYNYYVPPGSNGNIANDPCGCVATAMAQMMYYFHYPTTGVGTGSHSYQVNGVNYSGNLRGGDGNGGAYQWSNMPLAPNNPTTAQAEEIGDLCYDAGITVDMNYTADGSSSSDESVGPALTGTFEYSSSDYAFTESEFSATNMIAIINPNLDARLPVFVGIYSDADGGHEVLADGYGYSGSTLFHHLNMGWGGADAVWYQLPVIDTQDGNGEFTIVDSSVYNIYTNGTGMIISGRIIDPNGVPVVGATVTATRGGTYTTTTDTNGIYALIKLPANTTYSITAALSGYTSVSGSFATGTYVSGVYVGQTVSVANYWGANFVMTRALLVTPGTGFAAIGPVGGPFNITSQSYTLSNSTGSSISWAASPAPSWLTLSSTGGSVGAGASAGLTISLSAAASSMSAGTNLATLWITNKTTLAAQALQFSLVAAAADYPIAVTGFNDDVVVETSATGGDSFTYADTFDANNSAFNPATSFCFYESGLANINQFGTPVSGNQGLPQSGYFTSAVDNKTVFQFGPYAGYNVLALSPSNSSGTLTFATPIPYKSLSILAATAEGGGNGTFVVNFTDGTSSSALSFNAANYFVRSGSPGSGAALSQFGLLISGDYGNFYSGQISGEIYPVLYQTSVSLAASLTNKLAKSITFTMPSGQGTNAVTGVFAVSGTQSVSTGVSNGPFGFLTSKGGMYYSGGQFVLEVTNAAATGTVVIWDSTNLIAWTALYTNSSGASSFSFTDATANTYPHRFYRASK